MLGELLNLMDGVSEGIFNGIMLQLIGEYLVYLEYLRCLICC